MNEQMENHNSPWSYDDDKQLEKLYSIDSMSIMEISKIYKRTPGSIAARLCKNNIIPARDLARGYNEYQNSEFYKEASDKMKERMKKKDKPVTKAKNKEMENIFISIKKDDYIEIEQSINEIKGEMKEIKNTLTELVAMIKAVYDFEDT